MPDEKKRGPRKNSRGFTFLDAVILFLILAVAAVALYAYLPGLLSGRSGDEKTVEYTLCFTEPMDNASFNAIATDNTVISDKADFGKVIRAESVPDSEALTSSVHRSEDLHTVRLVVSAGARVSATAVRVSGKLLQIGEIYPVILPGYTGNAIVTDIRIGG